MITTPTKQSIGGVDCTIITNYFLRVLCGFILNVTAKGFVKDCVLSLTSIPSALLASFAVLFLINRRARRERKGFSDSFHLGIKYQLLNCFHFFFAEAGHQANFRYRITAVKHQPCRFKSLLSGTFGKTERFSSLNSRAELCF